MTDRPPPTLATLLTNLKMKGVHPLGTHATAVALEIKVHELSTAICAGAVVEGKWRCLRFSDYYAAVFGVDLDGKVVRKKRRSA